MLLGHSTTAFGKRAILKIESVLCRSASDPYVQQNMGLIGALIVTRADAATADGRPNDTDLELFAMFHVSTQLHASVKAPDSTLLLKSIAIPTVQLISKVHKSVVSKNREAFKANRLSSPDNFFCLAGLRRECQSLLQRHAPRAWPDRPSGPVEPHRCKASLADCVYTIFIVPSSHIRGDHFAPVACC